MKHIEKAGIIIIVLLLILRLLLGTGLNASLMVLFVLLTIYYMWFGFFLFNNVKFKQLFSLNKHYRFNILKISTSIIMGLIYSFSLLSLMFAFFFYTHMNLMLGLSFFMLLLSSAFFIIYSKINKTAQSYFYQFYFRSVAYGLICLFIWVTPVEKRLEVLFRDHPEFIEAYKNHLENPDDIETEKELRKQRNHFR